MPTVFLCSPTNSTMFTTCCEVAICDDQERCPRCKEIITPSGRNARWDVAYGPHRERERQGKNSFYDRSVHW
jgi:hypothetical protein